MARYLLLAAVAAAVASWAWFSQRPLRRALRPPRGSVVDSFGHPPAHPGGPTTPPDYDE